MTEPPTPDMPQPTRPSMRGAQRYDVLKEAVTTPANKDLFTMNITASMKGQNMNNDQQFLIDLVFKPNENGVRLTPQLTQLLLAHIGEILKEVEEEEKLIVVLQKVTADVEKL